MEARPLGPELERETPLPIILGKIRSLHFMSIPYGALRRFPILIVGLLGLTTSLWLQYTLHKDALRLARAEFDLDARELMLSIERELEYNFEVVEDLRALYSTLAELDREEFRSYARVQLSHHQSIRALGFDRRVTAAERRAHEESTRQEGFPEYQITERGVDGTMIPAADRPEYVVVHFLEPLANNEPALGYDIASEPIRNEAIERARATGKLAITGRLTLVQETGSQYGVLVIRAVNTEQSTADGDTVEPPGYVVAALRVGDAVESALSYFEPKGIRIQLLDESAPTDQRLLYLHPSSESFPERQARNPAGAQAPRFQVSRATEHGGRRWSLLATSTDTYLARHRSIAPWSALLSGLTITGLVVAYLWLLTARAARVQAQVEQRTVALQNIESANVSLAQLSREDALTGIPNRRYLDEVLDQEWRRAARRQTALAFVLLDVDHFKAYNDLFGHLSGDDCLKGIARAFADYFTRAGEAVARYGGEEFAAIVPGADLASVRGSADHFRQMIADLEIDHPESNWKVVTVSIGVASAVPSAETSLKKLIANADEALYQAKNDGRNCVRG